MAAIYQTSSSGGTATTTANGGAVDWTLPNKAIGIDATYTTCILTTAQKSYLLMITNMGWAVPAAARVTGFSVTSSSSASANLTENTVSLVKNSLLIGSNQSTSATLGVSNLYGSSANMWGLGNRITGEYVLDSSFGFGVQVLCTSNATASYDGMNITCNWSKPNGFRGRQRNFGRKR